MKKYQNVITDSAWLSFQFLCLRWVALNVISDAEQSLLYDFNVVVDMLWGSAGRPRNVRSNVLLQLDKSLELLDALHQQWVHILVLYSFVLLLFIAFNQARNLKKMYFFKRRKQHYFQARQQMTLAWQQGHQGLWKWWSWEQVQR